MSKVFRKRFDSSGIRNYAHVGILPAAGHEPNAHAAVADHGGNRDLRHPAPSIHPAILYHAPAMPLTESETCMRFITPALEVAGWDK